MIEQVVTKQRRAAYKTDLTDAQWQLIGALVGPAIAKSGCEPTDLREVINAILYQNKTGCPWDMLPHDLLPRSTVFGYYTKWQKDGPWERLLDTLRGEVRRATPRVVQTQGRRTDRTSAAFWDHCHPDGDRGFCGGHASSAEPSAHPTGRDVAFRHHGQPVREDNGSRGQTKGL